MQGRVAEGSRWAEQMLDTAQEQGDDDLLIAGHFLACACNHWMGNFGKCVDHANQVMDRYSAERHRHLVDFLYHDPRTAAGALSSLATWTLGYPDTAHRLNREKEEHARRVGHPFDLGYALTAGSEEFDERFTAEDWRSRGAECEKLGRENNLPVMWAIQAPQGYAYAFMREGRFTEAAASFKFSNDSFEAMGGRVKLPTTKSFIAEAMALTGDVDNALLLIDELIAQVERPGWEQRVHLAEILRLKGWMLSLKGDLAGAEQTWLASLEWARRQQAKSWELRTATSLARLLQSQGKRRKAHDLLAPIYNWFTEGFDTKDLQDAKALIDELAATPGSGAGWPAAREGG